MSSYNFRALLAIKLDGAKGDITKSGNILWTMDNYTSYVPSPLLYKDRLYFIRHLQPWISSVDAASGKPHFLSQRLQGVTGYIFASPLGADNKVYIACQSGQVLVLDATVNHFNVLAVNSVEDTFTASPVAVDNQLILRGESYLWVIEQDSGSGIQDSE